MVGRLSFERVSNLVEHCYPIFSHLGNMGVTQLTYKNNSTYMLYVCKNLQYSHFNIKSALSFLLHFLLPGNKRQSKMAAGKYECQSNNLANNSIKPKMTGKHVKIVELQNT